MQIMNRPIPLFANIVVYRPIGHWNIVVYGTLICRQSQSGGKTTKVLNHTSEGKVGERCETYKIQGG